MHVAIRNRKKIFEAKKEENGLLFTKVILQLLFGVMCAMIGTHFAPTIRSLLTDLNGTTVQSIQTATGDVVATADVEGQPDVITGAGERMGPVDSYPEDAVAMESLDSPKADSPEAAKPEMIQPEDDIPANETPVAFDDDEADEVTTGNRCDPGSQWIVKRGDTLSGIAKQCWGNFRSWQHLQDENNGINPLSLKTDQDPRGPTVLIIPEAPPKQRIARPMAQEPIQDDIEDIDPEEPEESDDPPPNEMQEELSAVDDWGSPNAPDDDLKE